VVKITTSSDGTVVRKHLSQCSKKTLLDSDDGADIGAAAQNEAQQAALPEKQGITSGPGKRRSV